LVSSWGIGNYDNNVPNPPGDSVHYCHNCLSPKNLPKASPWLGEAAVASDVHRATVYHWLKLSPVLARAVKEATEGAHLRCYWATHSLRRPSVHWHPCCPLPDRGVQGRVPRSLPRPDVENLNDQDLMREVRGPHEAVVNSPGWAPAG